LIENLTEGDCERGIGRFPNERSGEGRKKIEMRVSCEFSIMRKEFGPILTFD
jgi:hypothetical protein